MAAPELWDDQARAADILRERASLIQATAEYEARRQQLEDLDLMLDMALEEEDHQTMKEVVRDLARLYDTFPRLAERRTQAAGTLSGGEQQMLAVGRALMSRPRLMLLDEPSLGLAPLLVKEVFHLIALLNQRGVTILLVEQNAAAALAIAHHGYVLSTGRVALEGSGAELLANPQLQQVYLGDAVETEAPPLYS